jgi:hypothetical protein
MHFLNPVLLVLAVPFIEAVNISGKAVTSAGGSTVLIKGRSFGPGGLLRCPVVTIGKNASRKKLYTDLSMVGANFC